jgi:hypothetical protein
MIPKCHAACAKKQAQSLRVLGRQLAQETGGPVGQVLDRRAAAYRFAGAVGSPGRAAVVRLVHELDALDVALVCLFVIGLYTNYTIPISAKIPFPSAPAGLAGFWLLWRRRSLITPIAFTGLIFVLLAYLVSILWATNVSFLSRRLNGLIQLTYSIVIGYALFLTVVQGNRRQVSAMFLSIALVILVGCLLEAYGGLRPVSDAVRQVLYRRGIYENDLRDMLFYGRIRPKFFASEPSSVTFVFTLLSFLWLVISPWRHKFLVYLALVGVGLFAMPGPTLLLMVLLILPYMLFLSSRRNGRLNGPRVARVVIVAAIFVMVFGIAAKILFAERLRETSAGNDPSFFYRVQGPPLVALYVARNYPVAGTGLTGEPFIEPEVINVYVASSSFSSGWQILSPATELLINYFWLHWIYLGVLWGLVITGALSLWLTALGVPSVMFCWMVWAILGQSSGAYVGPTCWAVMFLSAAAAVLHQRSAEADNAIRPIAAPPVLSVQALWRETVARRADLRRFAPAILDGTPRTRAPLGMFPPPSND